MWRHIDPTVVSSVNCEANNKLDVQLKINYARSILVAFVYSRTVAYIDNDQVSLYSRQDKIYKL